MLKIYGASDDLVEVRDSNGKLSDEFGAYETLAHLIFSDGTHLKVEYCPPEYDGKWKIEIVKMGDGNVYQLTPAENDDDKNTDVLEIESDNIKSVFSRTIRPFIIRLRG